MLLRLTGQCYSSPCGRPKTAGVTQPFHFSPSPVWDGYGPSRLRGDFFDFEVGDHDQVCKGWVLSFYWQKKWQYDTPTTKSCNDVHGWYKAQIKQWVAHLWHRGLVRNIRHAAVQMSCISHTVFGCILHHFAFGCRFVTPVYGPWEHVPPMFGGLLTQATQLMTKGMRLRFVLCVGSCTTPHFVVNAMHRNLW